MFCVFSGSEWTYYPFKSTQSSWIRKVLYEEAASMNSRPWTSNTRVYFFKLRKMMKMTNEMPTAYCQKGCTICFQCGWSKWMKFFSASTKANEMKMAKKPLYSRFNTFFKEKSTCEDFHWLIAGMNGGFFADQSRYDCPNLLRKKNSSANMMRS